MNKEEAAIILEGWYEQAKGKNGCLGYIERYVWEEDEEALDMAVEALKARDVVENLTQDLADRLNDAYAKGYNAAKREIALSGEYERAYQRGKADATKWIPVSEKPKQEKKEYLIQTDSGYICSCRWTNVNHFRIDLATDWHWHIYDIPQHSKIVAWMEKPEPYKAESKE